MTAPLPTLPTQCLIGGEWRNGSTNATFDVSDPATGDLIAAVADGTVDDAMAAVNAASDALPDWADAAPRTRAEILRRAFELMTDEADAIAELIVRENGKVLNDARGEVAYGAEFFRWYAEEAPRAIGAVSTAPSGNNKILVVHQPVGVCAMVTPWNFPAAMATRKIAPALAAGCTVILKPAPETPLTALYLADLLHRAGVPDGVVNVIPTQQAPAVVREMVHDSRVRKLSFTGSTDVGRQLLHECADTVVNASMELGGNAPFVVFDDADIDAALDGAMVAKMRNGGEACTAANRFLVQRAVADEFASRLAERMGALHIASGLDDGAEAGPLINEAATHDVHRLVTDAVDRGASVLTGGHPLDRPGHFYPPTVLTDVAPDAEILHREIFGPVAPVVVFDDEREAIDLANNTEYGLVAYVYTADLARGLRVSEAIESGMIGLNRGLVSDPAAPFGGVKQSGIGREGGHEGLLDYLETKYIATDW